MFLEALLKILFGYVKNQPVSKVDDADYETSRVTDDDYTERDPLPDPDVSTLEEVELERDRTIIEVDFSPPAVSDDDLLDEDFWECFVDLTAKSNVKDKKGRRRRKGRRDWNALTQLVWHQTAFFWKPWRKGKWSSHHKINAHACFDTNGAILLLHNFVHYLWTANGFNPNCLSFEIMGNFEGIQGSGNWYKPGKFGRGRPTKLQITRCRQLTFWLLHPEKGPADDDLPEPLFQWRLAVRLLGYNPLKYVHAHRQSGTKNRRPNRLLDPGSEVWQKVGVWAQELYGLSDGGPGYRLPGAAAIPVPEWDPRMREETPVS